VPTSETIVYRGIRFRRYPDSPNRSDRVYFTPGGGHRKAGVGRLHQEIWKDLHGPIPAGYDVHHADHDPLNNDPTNLVCIPEGVHGSHHASSPERIAQSRLNIVAAIAAAPAWHASPEGIEWHRQHGAATWVDREVRDETCEYCGAVYQTRKADRVRFCSNNCKTQSRRVSGVDNVDRVCACCGEVWSVNKYSKSECCSRQCAQTLRSVRARGRVQPDGGR
jgi:hypothetical protein